MRQSRTHGGREADCGRAVAASDLRQNPGVQSTGIETRYMIAVAAEKLGAGICACTYTQSCPLCDSCGPFADIISVPSTTDSTAFAGVV